VPEFPPITDEAMRALPRWARVAFAAKCGRRVQPLLRQFGANPHPDVLQAFDQAITLAEQSAAQAGPAPGLEEALRQAATYAPTMAGLAQMRQPGSAPTPVPTSDIIDYAVAATARAAATCAHEAGAGNDAASAVAALESYHWAVHAALTAGVRGTDVVLRYDFWFLRDASDPAAFTDGTPVPPESFALEKELATYRRALPGLLESEGKFALVQGNQVVGAWESYEDALRVGFERYGLSPFLIKKIQANAD
jgi:hypothetical protein